MEDYTNRELGLLLEELREHIVEIKLQTTQTNGRVRKLELWRMFLIGAWAVLSMATPLAWYLILNSLSHYDQQIEAKISEAINENNNKHFEYETQDRN